MASDTDTQPIPNGAPIDQFSRRIRRLRKVFARGLGRRANSHQAMLILTAATTQADSERVALDPNASASDRVRAANVAHRARRDMEMALEPAKAMTAQRKAAPIRLPSADAFLRGHRA
jgi:hypothetical protein